MEPTNKDRERANGLVVGLLQAHADMLNRPNQWSKDSGAKNHYYGLRNEVERLLVIGVQEDRRRDEVRSLLTSPELIEEVLG